MQHTTFKLPVFKTMNYTSYRTILAFSLVLLPPLACTSEHSTNSTPTADNQQLASIKGTVIEADWDEPAVGATVSIDGQQQAATTDMDGSFELNGISTGEHQLIATFMNQADTLTLVVQEGENEAAFKLRF